jgi:hypothetical protein
VFVGAGFVADGFGIGVLDACGIAVLAGSEMNPEPGRRVRVGGGRVICAVRVGTMDGKDVGVTVSAASKVLDGADAGVRRSIGNASTVSAAAVFIFAMARSMMLGASKAVAALGFASAILATIHSRLSPRAPAATTHRRST